MKQSEVRTCIKCGRQLPLGMFEDNWRHRVNRCKDCVDAYKKQYNELSNSRKDR